MTKSEQIEKEIRKLVEDYDFHGTMIDELNPLLQSFKEAVIEEYKQQQKSLNKVAVIGHEKISGRIPNKINVACETVEEAKEKAQQHFNELVNSCLSIPEASVPSEEEIENAKDEFLNSDESSTLESLYGFSEGVKWVLSTLTHKEQQ